ncbi:MAG: CoA transferase [Hyphomicrobiaceae bacterium]|nr:MAG: CoA transferase [Hyphomicrobiaceae bacterium]
MSPIPVPAGRPLAGVRVIDLSRLAPGPYCTMLLADMGAEVIAVGAKGSGVAPTLARGKTLMQLDLKQPEARAALHRLVATADVLVEGFRPGVADRLEAGYAQLSAINPRLVYCSLTGYGQTGPRAQEAGHDINYLAVSGVLGAMGPADRPPCVPLNLIADFACGSLMAALGILAALQGRHATGRGCWVDVAMIDGCLSMMGMHFDMWGTEHMARRGAGLLDGGAPFYRCYACADGGHVAVGALESRFFGNLWRVLDFRDPVPDHMDPAIWPDLERRFAAAFMADARDVWAQRFKGQDACVSAVLAPDEVWSDPHIAARHADAGRGRTPIAPRFGADMPTVPPVDMADRTAEVLAAIGMSEGEIERLVKVNAAEGARTLKWPPHRRASQRPGTCEEG